MMDVAEGHVKAIEYLDNHKGYETINLGAGHGYSLLPLVKACEDVNQVKIPYVINPRREGDLAAYWADASKAEKLLGWITQLTLEDMVRDSWAWQSKNPKGFND